MSTTDTLKPGIYRDVPLAEYLEWPAWGSSDLRAMREGPPALVKWRREHREQTEAMKLGSAAHCAILEPKRFVKCYARKPDGMKFSTTEGKAWQAAVPDGTVILTPAESLQVDQIAVAFNDKLEASRSLVKAQGIETSIVWQDPVSGCLLKARPDWYDDEALYDLKVSREAGSAPSFKVWANGWMHQLAHNRAGLNALGIKVKAGRLVMIGPKPPQRFRTYLFEIKEDALDACALENAATIAELVECDMADSWPGTPEDWMPLDLPNAAFRDLPIWPDGEGGDLAPLTS